jgi:polysaccharide biosynthesis protein PelG
MLVLAYFLFITMFILTHILMYFDDQKGVLLIGGLFVVLNIGFTYWTMYLGNDGLGMFLASLFSLVAVITRLLYVLRNIDYFTFCSQPINPKKLTKEKSFFNKQQTFVSVLLVLSLGLSACTTDSANGNATGQEAVAQPVETVAPVEDSTRLVEDKRIYERDQDGSLKTIYVTILPDKPNADNRTDWYGLNRIPKNVEKKLDIIMQEGTNDGKGPASGMFGFGAAKANGSITLRGRTAWETPQKSYRIKLNDEAGLWLDQRSFNLNKHSLDLSRVRNKLSYDLFEQIPDITSLRTQFVRMYVKDLSTGASQAPYVDYGLYTHVEQPNKQFLKAHMLDPNGYLYKIYFFEFYRYEENIKSHDDPQYNKAAFEQILEIKGREEHDKLIKMLNDVNDRSIPIEEVVEKHFDLDNFLTWTAANILMDNMDTDANNYYLYSPLNSDKWYFIPWDYDGGWELQRRKGSTHPYQNGISNYWGSVLHNRYFRHTENVDKLKVKMEELSKVINKERITQLLNSYTKTVEPFLFRNPDIDYLPALNSGFKNELEIIANTPERAMKRFLEDLEKPKPFYQDDAVMEDGLTKLSWQISFDLQGDELVYDVSVSKNPEFTQIVANKNGIRENRLEIPELPPGTYYWRVIARDSKGNKHNSFDYYVNSDSDYFFGMREFEVE